MTALRVVAAVVFLAWVAVAMVVVILLAFRPSFRRCDEAEVRSRRDDGATLMAERIADLVDRFRHPLDWVQCEECDGWVHVDDAHWPGVLVVHRDCCPGCDDLDLDLDLDLDGIDEVAL